MQALTPELVKKIRRIEISSRRLVEELLRGAYRSAFKGNGLEFEEVRPFEPGDDIRAIDWNVTARNGTPFIKTFREERERCVMLLIDCSASTRFGSLQKPKREIMAQLAAALAFSAIRNLDKIGLILFSEGIDLYLPPKKGTRHVLRVIRELLVDRPLGKTTNINHALTFLMSVQKKSTISFVISDFISGTQFKTSLKIAAKHHDLIGIKVVDHMECQLPLEGLLHLKDLETGEEMAVDVADPLLRAAFANQKAADDHQLEALFGKSDAGFIQIRTDEPYERALYRYFQRHKKR